MVLDVYRHNTTVYVDLNPANWIEMPDKEILEAAALDPAPAQVRIRRTIEYNVAIFMELEFTEPQFSIKIADKIYEVKQPPTLPLVDLQLCLVFKNEWARLPTVLNYYRRTHGVQRFILYDNQSEDPPSAELMAQPDVVYERWSIPYKHTITDKKNLSPTYGGPETIIIAQNSAYSHCLKRYRQATWTMLFDTDEFIVRRRGAEPLISLVQRIPPTIDTILMKGYWAGCNSIKQSEIYNSLNKFARRSQKFCMNKLILRTASHVFTNCIHNPYPNQGKIVMLSPDRGLYFFHLYTASSKNRPCDCKIYCQVPDRSFQESLTY